MGENRLYFAFLSNYDGGHREVVETFARHIHLKSNRCIQIKGEGLFFQLRYICSSYILVGEKFLKSIYKSDFVIFPPTQIYVNEVSIYGNFYYFCIVTYMTEYDSY